MARFGRAGISGDHFNGGSAEEGPAEKPGSDDEADRDEREVKRFCLVRPVRIESHSCQYRSSPAASLGDLRSIVM